ncbi:multifunctional oxoglutarate decarboxylase/oxoglutarate dehydrogenase thiamine pyrophosphate-binding subunit/dihydrolipoyllysine-residue succinyltransferase subunit [Egibacter rhizosphaerae]|uniref:Multifunctional oxoglutarate decarboxylase/oxoglutarate dehydrogenase thiamine pyrophosphate-binding subunit/dihydrolipoyllysine-residue succinyltransferase subunit n=1 Tax=Egibacter rhizosphaerae TaxID=1670831 RepID=A0A411YE09_9ACTN|nr:multifunctional oxoglutarate decarboxylase/oxoglutarate dehydrogenase thiamine pyrophosphate-binding subunit/dihydrolipoyllysine-residue succinyltransferase subunit [Egibacter rhizosphaerae]QBI19410.1 multifunctional oxoglutarate decarboxylase/oxoglutarate dehydrogenase thiamine pyrophosphate-binding subunit/dihydrolipoyllysine-residue succinyltransferase subunit [Egibacter rhizosphaerae]
MTDQRQFGTNSWIVDELYREYLADPDAVGESWKEFFADYTPGWDRDAERDGARNGRNTADAPAIREEPARTAGDEGPAPSAEQPGGRTGPVGTAPSPPEDAQPLRGVSATIADNMRESLGVPTATSIREIPAKLLEVNRRILNNQMRRTRGGKVSFTHLIGWAVVKAMTEVPAMTTIYYEDEHGKAHSRRPDRLNLGLAMDVERRDGSRTLLVPNVKDAATLDFAGFYHAYEEVVRKVRTNDLSPELFEGTTATLTNPGTVGTVGSVPRLMTGQSAIIGVGAIDYPAEYQGADERTLAEVGVGKVITLTSTYDHRVVQGAESGLFLKAVHELLLGERDFYDEVFESLRIPYEPVRWRTDENPRLLDSSGDTQAAKQIAVGRLINMYRVRGHLIANLNPLYDSFTEVHPELDPVTYGLTIWDLDREFLTGGLGGGPETGRPRKLSDILGILRDAYCRTIGVEYMHIQEPSQKAWIQQHVEGARIDLDHDEQVHILERLNDAEAFEKFLHTKYIGHKRFGLEGAESAIPMLDVLLSQAADEGIDEAVMGMAHRGRLNVLTNILGKDYNKIFRQFEGDIDPDSVQGSGDVKYHVGTRGRHTSPEGHVIDVALSSNPSHLEAVDPVVTGMARALLERKEATGLQGEGDAADHLGGVRVHHGQDPDDGTFPVLPILLHGDAAFAGQGVVAETFALSQLDGYATGGTVHLVINNQLGFTTAPHQGRSSEYATDVAKMVQAPIFHVNGDDPEACVRVMKLAFAFRQAFAKDVVVDMVCYRRHGHNESDDPSYTQPIMYEAIEQRRSVRKIYTEELVNRGDITAEEAEASMDAFRQQLESALKETRASTSGALEEADVPPPESHGVLPSIETGVSREQLDRIVHAVTSWPDGFTVHPKLGRQLKKRRDLLEKDAIDWAMGEALAFGSLCLQQVPVRLAGQDSARGTFSQRHAVLVDYEGGPEHMPLARLDPEQAPFAVYDSPLSEFAAMGFEYGYSVVRKDALVMWEAQFGDFMNGGQVIIDQFMVAAEAKWNQTSGLVLLLPHGYEGQGPEHSSARIERFLTLAAHDNIQAAQPTTAAQYFHLLRRQVLREIRKPLIVFTPKGMLRAKDAQSPAAAFEQGHFREVLPDRAPPEHVRRVLLCSGKLAHQLMNERDEREAAAAVVRIEQLYPWPEDQILEAIEAFPDANEVFFVQDEPENMGPWPFAHQRLHRILRDRWTLKHISRPESASPATGSPAIHQIEEQELFDATFDGL